MSTDLWPAVHAARQQLADDLEALPDDAWRQPTLCSDWDVEHVVAHLTAAATTGRVAWLRSMLLAGFRPAVHNERRLREQLGPTPAETLARFRAVIDSTTAPTGDTAAWLGEVVVHAEDIRHPLGIPTRPNVEALTPVADFFATKDFAVNSRTVAKGLRLRATDGPFEAGTGPEVCGPTLALVMVMAGRPSHLAELDGPGLGEITQRLATP